jgi:hypothetical protein
MPLPLREDVILWGHSCVAIFLLDGLYVIIIILCAFFTIRQRPYTIKIYQIDLGPQPQDNKYIALAT